MTDTRPWTKQRVLRAYAEWQALERHAENVVARHRRAQGGEEDDRAFFDRLKLPGWFGTGWPGGNFEWVAYDAAGYELDSYMALPLNYLWTNGWEREMQRKHDAWTRTAEAKQREQEERAEYERLKAKFGETEPGT